MRRLRTPRRTLSAAAVVVALAGSALLAGAAQADGPLATSPWPQAHRDGSKSGRTSVSGPTQPVQAWSIALNSPVVRGPVIGRDGMLYVGTEDGRVRAVTSNGQDKWTYTTDNGIPSQPLVNTSEVVTVGVENGFIVGLDRGDGSVKWKIDLRTAPYGTSDDPKVRGEVSGASNYSHLLVGTDHGVVYELDDSGGVLGVRRATGAVRAGEAVTPDGTVVWASFAREVYGGYASGGDKWRFVVDGEVWGTPSVSSDSVIYVPTNAGSLYALRSDGSQLWKSQIGGGKGMKTSPAIGADGTLYLGNDDGKFFAINAKDGSVKWTFQTGGAITASAAIGGNGLIYVGSNDQTLYVLGPDGKQVSTFKTGGGIDYSSPAIGADGTLYVGARDGRLYALKEGASATATPAGTPPAAPSATATPAPIPTATPTPLPTDRATPLAGAQYFGETGHNVRGAFATFFSTYGGVTQFGYPRTEEFAENGLTVQYFQRARFEFHPENAGTPYEVQLQLLGDVVTADRRPFPTAAPVASTADARFYPEVSHTLQGVFLQYFDANGGLNRFGYPISEQLQEQNNDGTGRTYTVQYFQRARLEYHPENAGTPFEIQLGLLGDQVLIQRGWLKG